MRFGLLAIRRLPVSSGTARCFSWLQLMCSALLRVVADKYGPRYFMNQVYAAGLSGSECFVWTAVEVQNLDRTWIHLARSGQHVVCDSGCYPDASANACAMMREKNCQYHWDC